MLSVAQTIGQAGPNIGLLQPPEYWVGPEAVLLPPEIWGSGLAPWFVNYQGVLLLCSHSNLCLLKALCFKVFGPLIENPPLWWTLEGGVISIISDAGLTVSSIWTCICLEVEWTRTTPCFPNWQITLKVGVWILIYFGDMFWTYVGLRYLKT